MSLDVVDLEILKRSGTATQKSYAERIVPVRRRLTSAAGRSAASGCTLEAAWSGGWVHAGLDCYARLPATQLAVTQLQQHGGRPAGCLASNTTSCALAAACAQVLRRPHVLLTTLLVCNAVAAEVRCGGMLPLGGALRGGCPAVTGCGRRQHVPLDA